MEKDSTLRPYQQQTIERILEAWRRERNVMLQMPTGTGKTRLFVSLIYDIKERAREDEMPRFLIVTHREELLEQISATLTAHYRLPHGILQGCNSRDLEECIIVASIQSLGNHALESNGTGHFDYIIIDEAHHALAESYRSLWALYPEAYKLGVTATPYRLRRKSFAGLFQRLITSQPIAEFIREGYLSDFRFFTVNASQSALQKVNRLTKLNIAGDYQTKDLQEIYANSQEIEFLYGCYEEYAKGKRGIVYAVNRLHAEMIAQCFAAHGVKAVNIDSKTAAKTRKTIIGRFRRGEIEVLVNVELFGEGFDCPAIEFAMLARPTKSLAMYLQQVGRALRPTPSGEPVTILDCVGLHHRFGLPERERDWALHFFGHKSTYKEVYTKPLGEVSCYGNCRMIEIPRIRKGFHKQGEGMAECESLTKTLDGWAYGMDRSHRLTVFDRTGKEVFQMPNSNLTLHQDGTFTICITAPDGEKFHIGPINKNMFFTDRRFKSLTIGCPFICNEVKLYRHLGSGLIVNFAEPYKLAMQNEYYRDVIADGSGALFIDVNNRRKSRSLLDNWHYSTKALPKWLVR